jgi:ATP-dependent Clp protease ATP-binding subunit ClpC
MTSNIGSRKLEDFGSGVGFSTIAKKNNSEDYSKSIIKESLKKKFAPEFLNRIDEIILFNSLKTEDIDKIIEIEIEKLLTRLDKIGFNLKITNSAKKFISKNGFDPSYGARPLKRAIQKYVEDNLAEEMIQKNIKSGDKVSVDYDNKNEKIVVKVLKNKKIKK